MRKQVIAYLHTHWDREWYREYEIFRMRLLRVFDNVLNLLENNRIPSFYFDGQVSALEDYLELRPEKEKLVRSLIRAKKLFLGPFYCLIDEFMTDKTVCAKNLELGMTKAIEFGCTDFIGYLADTFGHSQNLPDMLRDFGIDKCIVWRGCGDFPAEFKWCGMDTVNLVRGYFQDIFSLKCTVEEKAELLKKNLDLISEKSGMYVLLPIGADHLGVPEDIQDQILAVNEILKDDYNIKLGSPFEYFKSVSANFEKFKFDDELRDNSKTFTLQGCYSSRLDLKRYNVESTYKLDLATRFVKFLSIDNPELEEKYMPVINHAYKLLIQNQAHDGICGCSTDEVYEENIIRYKKIAQIAQAVIDELKFEMKFEDKMVINLSDKFFSGIVEFESSANHQGFEVYNTRKGFDRELLTDTSRIPVTEDYTDIRTYLAEVKHVEADTVEFIMQEPQETDLVIDDNYIGNDKISLKIVDGNVLINDVSFNLVDFVDLGDSYNFGPKADDGGTAYKLLRSKIAYKGDKRVALKLDFEGVWDIISSTVSLDKGANYLKFDFEWDNSQKNHLLQVNFVLPSDIKEVFSEDMNLLIKRMFDPEYDIRKNLPNQRGIEAKTNTAPMQRGLLIDENDNNIGIITKGLTQYEVYKNNLYIPILRSTGMISNPMNPARTTPAGPPIEVRTLQGIGRNKAEFYVFFGNSNAFDEVLSQVYNYVIT